MTPCNDASAASAHWPSLHFEQQARVNPLENTR